jgi:NAD(P)H-nitrite reductase large subunit
MQILIIGNGIAGITAARTIRKLSDHQITVVSSETPYFFSRTALMYVYMGHMRWKDLLPYETWFWKKNKINLLNDHVTTLDPQNKTALTSGGMQLHYDKLIIATGSSSNMLPIPGIDLDGVSGLYAVQDLQYIESKSKDIKRAVIIGGGLIGIELAEMFHSRGIPVSLLVRESSYSDMILPAEESEMVNREIREHGIDLRLSTEVLSIKGNDDGRVKSVVTNHGEEIPCQFTGITTGVHPNIDWLKDSALETRQGIMVDQYLQTNFPDVYAIGDCAQMIDPAPGRKAIEPLWYTGRMMGETVAHTVCGNPKKYEPGIWFNSAKFFGTEYQVYGDIRPVLSPGQQTLYWQHPYDRKSIRINYTSHGVIGFNLIGVRFRQDVCEKWIRMQSGIEEVLSRLELALFDAEFSDNYAFQVREAYRRATGKTVAAPQEERSYNRMSAFLRNFHKPKV